MSKTTPPSPICPKFLPVQARTNSNGIRFSLVSYNILAKVYVHRPSFPHSSFFPHSPPPCLEWEARSQAILTVLQSLGADFLCLQELDEYDNFYKKNTEIHGYSSVYIQRSGQKRDGCGIFYKRNRADLLLEERIDYNDLANLNEGESSVSGDKHSGRLREDWFEGSTSESAPGGRGQDQVCGRGRGQDQVRGRGRGQGQARGQDQVHGRGQDQDRGRGRGQGQARGQDQVHGRGQDQVRGRGRGQGQARGRDQVHGRGQDQVRGRGRGQGQARGQDQVHGRGQDQVRGRGRGQGRGDPNDPRVRYKRDCVGVMAAFKLKDPSHHIVIVANTHLYWDPQCIDVKLAQAGYLLSRLANFRTLVSDRFECSPSVILAGDFNSTPGDKVYHYLVSGNSSSSTSRVERFNELPVRLHSLYGHLRGEPPFTTCTPHFKNTLDYIFFSPDDSIKPVSFLELPEVNSPDVLDGLPNYYHPSDHLPIGAEFEITRK